MNYENIKKGFNSIDSEVRNKSIYEIALILQNDISIFHQKVLDEIDLKIQPMVDSHFVNTWINEKMLEGQNDLQESKNKFIKLKTFQKTVIEQTTEDFFDSVMEEASIVHDEDYHVNMPQHDFMLDFYNIDSIEIVEDFKLIRYALFNKLVFISIDSKPIFNESYKDEVLYELIKEIPFDVGLKIKNGELVKESFKISEDVSKAEYYKAYFVFKMLIHQDFKLFIQKYNEALVKSKDYQKVIVEELGKITDF